MQTKAICEKDPEAIFGPKRVRMGTGEGSTMIKFIRNHAHSYRH